MRWLFLAFAERMSPFARRVMILLASAGLALYARATADAWQRGEVAQLVAGAVLTAGFAAFGALVWSVRRKSAVG
jgi:hypothetical protein